MNLQHILISLDFSEDETRVYMALLAMGSMAAGALAKHMGMPRPSLYGFLERLIQKGAVTQTLHDGVKHFSAERPEVISKLFQDKIENLERKKAEFQDLIPEIVVNSSNVLNPKFEFFEGREGIENVLKDMLLYSGASTRSYWPMQKMVEILSPKFFHYHNRVRIQNRISVQAIWPEDQLIKIKNHPYLGAGKEYLREIRVAPSNVHFSMGYWIYKNKVAFLSSRKESFGFIIESNELAEMMTSQHEFMWQGSKKLVINEADMEEFIREIRNL